MRKIDVFNHIFPARYVERMMQLAATMKDVGKRVRGVPMLANLDVRFEVMDAHPGYQQILSIATPPVEVFASPIISTRRAEVFNILLGPPRGTHRRF